MTALCLFDFKMVSVVTYGMKIVSKSLTIVNPELLNRVNAFLVKCALALYRTPTNRLVYAFADILLFIDNLNLILNYRQLR